MVANPTPLQRLFLLRLLSVGGGDFQSRIKPNLPPNQRRSLEQAGLIETERRQKQSPGKRSARANYISLTDRGWGWIAENLDGEISPKSTASGPVLRTMLSRLKVYLDRKACSLAEFMAGSEQHETLDSDVNHSSVLERVRCAYSDITEHQMATRVRLADLRSKLGDVPTEELNNALLGMERAESIALYPLDNPQEMNSDDEQAAIPNSAGEQRHVVYMEN